MMHSLQDHEAQRRRALRYRLSKLRWRCGRALSIANPVANLWWILPSTFRARDIASPDPPQSRVADLIALRIFFDC